MQEICVAQFQFQCMYETIPTRAIAYASVLQSTAKTKPKIQEALTPAMPYGKNPPLHTEVMEAGKAAAGRMGELLAKVLKQL